MLVKNKLISRSSQLFDCTIQARLANAFFFRFECTQYNEHVCIHLYILLLLTKQYPIIVRLNKQGTQ